MTSSMQVQPPSVLLMGASGSGKTYSISTLLASGLEVFAVITEPHGLESLLDAVQASKLDMNKLHWVYISPTRPGFKALLEQGELIARSNQKFLADQVPKVREDPGWIRMYQSLLNFKCERDGKEYGAADSWGPNRVLVVDSLTGVSKMAWDLTIGNKVTANPGEWGIAQNTIEQFLWQCCGDLKCMFVMTAHTEKEEDPLTGIGRIMSSTLGKKLAPKIPSIFSEVVLADSTSTDKAKDYFWATSMPNHVLKNRALPISSKLPPTFQPIVEAYRKRLELIRAA